MSQANTPITFDDLLNDNRVEEAYRQAVINQRNGRQTFADIGYRAAIAKDAKLLKALEAMAEVTGKLQEQQMGRTMRDPGAIYSTTRGTTEHQLCREAYRLCDEGRPIRNFEWIYGAAAWLCGYVS